MVEQRPPARRRDARTRWIRLDRDRPRRPRLRRALRDPRGDVRAARGAALATRHGVLPRRRIAAIREPAWQPDRRDPERLALAPGRRRAQRDLRRRWSRGLLLLRLRLRSGGKAPRSRRRGPRARSPGGPRLLRGPPARLCLGERVTSEEIRQVVRACRREVKPLKRRLDWCRVGQTVPWPGVGGSSGSAPTGAIAELLGVSKATISRAIEQRTARIAA